MGRVEAGRRQHILLHSSVLVLAQSVESSRSSDLCGAPSSWMTSYEVMVKTDGKDWKFEVDPNGKVVKKHEADHKKK